MPTLTLSLSPFTLRSTWVGMANPGQYAQLTVPSEANRNVVYGVSALPRGAVVESAVLTVERTLSGPGTFLVQRSPELTQDLRALIQPEISGTFPDLTVNFFFQAAATGGSGFHEVRAEISSAELTISYTLPDDPAPEPKPDAAPFRAPARKLTPRGVLQFPDGSRLAVGAESILSFRVDQGVDDGPLLGKACAAMLSIRLANAEGEWMPGGSLRGRRPLLGAWLSLFLAGEGENGPFSVPLGSFRLEEMAGEENGLFLELRGFDAMAASLEKPWQPLALPATLNELKNRAVALGGLPVSGSLPCNGGTSCAVQPVPAEGGTIREALANICGAGGAFALIAPDGTLRIRAVNTAGETPVQIGPDQTLRLAHDERAFSFRHLLVQPDGTAGAEDLRAFSLDESEPTGENALMIRRNPLFPYNSPQLGALSEPLKAALTGAGWQALSLTWRWEPAAVLGTPLEVTTRDGNVIRSVLCGQSISWDGGLRAEAWCGVETGVDR